MALGRRALAEKLVEFEKKVEPDLLKIDGYKEQLREVAKEEGAGFTEEFPGQGTVEVSSAREARFKGLVPKLKAELFVGLSKARQDKLVEDGLVEWVTEYTQASKPSVTVRL